MDQEIDASRNKSVPRPVEGHDTSQEEDYYPGHRPEYRDVIQQKRQHSPEYGVAQAAELHRNPGCGADQGVHHCDREQIPADVLLNLTADLYGCAFVLEARQHLNETAQ